MPVELATEIVELAIKDLVCAYPDRTEEDMTKIGFLANSFKLHGQFDPIRVIEDGDAKYKVIQGKRRVAAARQIGMKEIKAIIVDLKDIKDSTAVLADNMAYAPPNKLARAKWVQEMLEAKVYKDQKDIAAALGTTQPNISKMLSELEIREDLPEEIKEEIEDEEITVGEAVKATKLAKKKKAKPTADDVSDEIKESKKNKFVKIHRSALIPENAKGPIDTIKVLVGKEVSEITFVLKNKGLVKNGILKRCEEELALIGDDELAAAIDRQWKQSF